MSRAYAVLLRQKISVSTSSVITCLLFTAVCGAIDISEYKIHRETLLRDELLVTLGGNTNLTDKETAANNCLMQHKFRELDYGFDNPQFFNFSRHFFSYKEKIRESKVYQIIRDMPKGAALHIHDTAVLGPDYLLNITYLDHLYACFEKDMLQMKFSNSIPEIPCSSTWQLMSEARKLSGSITDFDSELRKHFTLVVDDPDIAYPSIKESWDAFRRYFVTIAPLLSYLPIWEKYFYDSLKLFRQNNVMYIEVRKSNFNLYNLNGTVFNHLITVEVFRNTVKRFVKDYPDFVGAKLIYAPSRKSANTTTLDVNLNLARRIKQEMPEIFAGFDLVGQEDLGRPLKEFMPQLTAAANDLDYFFHAGETDRYGCSTDDNLVDAILLGAKRLGHAYALPKHPLLMKKVVENDIGLEVNVISNNVLSLVRDVRNHPLSIFLAQGLPVVLSSDDPGAWEADPISDDFYVAFVGVASRLSDLRLLKALALNSLKYSALGPREKKSAIDIFNSRWNQFIDTFNCSMY